MQNIPPVIADPKLFEHLNDLGDWQRPITFGRGGELNFKYYKANRLLEVYLPLTDDDRRTGWGGELLGYIHENLPFQFAEPSTRKSEDMLELVREEVAKQTVAMANVHANSFSRTANTD